MATAGGARALGFADGGALTPGGRADFALFDHPGLSWRPASAVDAQRRLAREGIEAALLGGYRAASLTVFRGIPYGFTGLQPFPA
jgi:cytosine/adenosine deaminase-related metal-dependent hydrolase